MPGPHPAVKNAADAATELSDASIAAQVAGGDVRGALVALMARHGTEIHRFCFQQLRDAALAEDVVQTVFVQAYQDLPQFQARASVRAWLFSIARNRCVDELRRARRWRNLITWPGTLPDHGTTPSEPEPARRADHGHPGEAGGGAWRAAFRDCLDKLSPRVRECVLLRFSANLSYEEIANITGHRTGTLRTRIARALPALRRCLQRKGVEP